MSGHFQARGGGLGAPSDRDAMEPSRVARAALSRLMEPGDATGAALVNALGPVDALAVATGRVPPDLRMDAAVGSLVIGGGAGAWEGLASAQERWRGRVADLAPRRDLETIARFGGRMLIPEDPEWPEGFADLGARAPIALWVRGEENLPRLRHCAAVVGSRDATSYGLGVAGEISKGLVDRGVTVVSGGVNFHLPQTCCCLISMASDRRARGRLHPAATWGGGGCRGPMGPVRPRGSRRVSCRICSARSRMARLRPSGPSSNSARAKREAPLSSTGMASSWFPSARACSRSAAAVRWTVDAARMSASSVYKRGLLVASAGVGSTILLPRRSPWSQLYAPLRSNTGGRSQIRLGGLGSRGPFAEVV